MKLTKLVLTGFRSIKGTEQLTIDPSVTVLIGANDHGKSNILAAIHCLNDDKQIGPEDANWDLANGSPVIIEWVFKPSLEDLNKLRVHEYKSGVDKAEKEVHQVIIGSDDPVVIEAEVPEAVVPEETCFELNTEGAIIYRRDNQTNQVRVKSLPFQVSIKHEPEVLAMRPQVELFDSPTGNVADEVTRQDLDDPKFEPIQGIFRLSGIWDKKDDIFIQNPTTSKILDIASIQLTKILNERWKQGKDLSWNLKHSGTNGNKIQIEIGDPSINSRYSRPSIRSSGFRTYFMLSMIILARTQNKPNDSYLFLFDEPGTYLHPHAQLDLQRSFAAVSENTQIIYTTHSIFLINKNDTSRNRVVSKTLNGTKIDQKPFVKNWKSVRESLGILLSNNFLIAEKTLLVEGPSDVIYIQMAIRNLKSKQAIDIDLNDLSIVDAGSSDNYIAMAKLMLLEGRDVVALLDGDVSGKRVKKQLEKVCVKELAENRLSIHLLPDNDSIEDVLTDINILRSSIMNVVNNLTTSGAKEIADSIDITIEMDKIIQSSSQTLGLTIDQITAKLFVPEEKLSKLSIALEYETQVEGNQYSLSSIAKETIITIKEKLNLRGEKSVESGVFDEVSV